jgi:PAS domain S-box-containing protein
VHYEDVTERRRDELELHEARMRFERAFEHAPIGMALVDLDEESFGRLRRVNAALCLLLGRGREELVGLRLRDLTHPDDVEANLAAAAKLLDGDTDSYHTEKRFLTPAGDVLVTSFSASVVRDAAGNPLYGVAQVDDVTGRRRAEAAVVERERRFRSAFSLALDAMWICDDSRRLKQVNRATSELLGLPIEDITGRLFDDFTPMDRDALDEVWARFLEHGGLTEQFEVLTAEGEVRQVEVSARANFTPGRHLSILRDVTERHRAEEARERARAETDRLEAALHQAQKMETVGQLAGGAAHDFNNILAVILNASEFALSDLGEHPAARDVEAIRDAAKRAAALTRQLLVFSRREISRPEILDLRELVCSVEDLLRRTIGEHIELVVEITDDVPAIEADPSHVEQVLLNLAVNARDAMPEGGRLCLGVSATDLDEEQARLQPGLAAGRYARLTVTDTGAGMPDEVLERAFEPFFTTKAKGMGTGLGLATTYGIVRENNGHIELRSVTGSGTTATVLLPAAVGERPASTSEPVAERRGAGQRILLVEDDEAVRTITERMLTSSGYDVICAADPGAALEIAAAEGVDGVMTDVVMPGMSGPTLVEKLRGVTPGLPALFVSGYTDRPGALPRGAKFLSKPFSREALLASIADMLEDDA